MHKYFAVWEPGQSIDNDNNFVTGTHQWLGFKQLTEMDTYHAVVATDWFLKSWEHNAMQLYVADGALENLSFGALQAKDKNFKFKMLLSYWFFKNIDMEEMLEKYFPNVEVQIFADSGGFSAWSQGVHITVDEYAEWLYKWKHLFEVYLVLDSIGNTEKTWDNHLALQSLGLDPLPALTAGGKNLYWWLEFLVERYNYIALGGLVPYAGRKKRLFPHVARCFRIAGDKAVFHGLGLTGWQTMRSFDWYSVDSSSWGQGFRYGQVPVFDYNRGRFHKVQLGDREGWKKIAHIVERMGFDPIDFADRDRNDRLKICGISALSFLWAERWITEFRGKVEVPKLTKQEPFHLYLADAKGSPNLDLAKANKELNK